ncbi:hypothetical protein AB3M83_07500 [Microbacterium sp. 179-B 1A2 NHS]|uniref:hypothetical protein n=1 Tax=Microbacterium sp. 179-B 1A2 NHS TaxID=3142383 RepID=UPI0039A14065
MVAHVLRLRLALLLGSLRTRGAVLARRLLAALALVIVLGAVCIAVARLADAPRVAADTLTLVLGSALVLGFALLPLFLGAEDPLDPRRFAVLGRSPGWVAGTVAAASVISLPILAVIAVAAAMAVAWTGHGAAGFLAVIAAFLGVATCLLSARCAMAIGALALRDRRTPQLTGLMVTAALILVVPAAVFLASLEWGAGLPPQLVEAARGLALTPLGAAWAIGLRRGGDLVGPLAVAVATLLALAVLWAWLTRRMLTTTSRPVPVRERRGLGWFAVMPGTPGGAIAARGIVYWFSDARHLANIIIVPIASVLVIVPLLVVGVPVETVALIPAPLMALFFGWLAHNDLAYDSTGIWLHLAAGVRGFADRMGRLAPVVLIAVPLLAVAVTLSVWAHDRWDVLPAMIGVCASLFASGLGLSSISSAVAPYPVSRPGDGPFEQPQRTGGGMAQSLVLLGAVLLSAPTLWWAWLTLTRDAQYAWTALWGGVAIGLAVLIAGVVVGGVAFERRSSRIMEFAETM